MIWNLAADNAYLLLCAYSLKGSPSELLPKNNCRENRKGSRWISISKNNLSLSWPKEEWQPDGPRPSMNLEKAATLFADTRHIPGPFAILKVKLPLPSRPITVQFFVSWTQSPCFVAFLVLFSNSYCYCHRSSLARNALPMQVKCMYQLRWWKKQGEGHMGAIRGLFHMFVRQVALRETTQLGGAWTIATESMHSKNSQLSNCSTLIILK